MILRSFGVRLLKQSSQITALSSSASVPHNSFDSFSASSSDQPFSFITPHASHLYSFGFSFSCVIHFSLPPHYRAEEGEDEDDGGKNEPAWIERFDDNAENHPSGHDSR